jgi:hypothetical protein
VNLGLHLEVALERVPAGAQGQKTQHAVDAERKHRHREGAGRVLAPRGLFKGVEHGEVAAILATRCDFGRTSG